MSTVADSHADVATGPGPSWVDTGRPVDELLARPVWSDATVEASGLRIQDMPFVAIGGGLASFAIVDVLRVCGVPTDEIRVISPQRCPYENIRYLLHCSQILDRDPLRSDSMSRVDNIWGFPSYAVEQAATRRTLRPLWQVLAEPLAAEFFNPTPDQVFRGVDREARRIDWASMLMPGRMRVIRRRAEGGYFGLVYPMDGSGPMILRSQYVHLGTGHSAVNYPSEVVDYRTRYHDYFGVVNAYEPHEHVYQVLKRRPGTVVIRGSGITAARVLERLLADRERSGQDVRILHLFRTYVDGPQGPWTFRRPGGQGWRYQAFNFPKAAGSGQLRDRLRTMDNTRRAEFIKSMGATTSAKRRLWQRQLRRARAAGSYRALHGDVRTMVPAGDDSVELCADIVGRADPARFEADFVIDCTGLRLSLRDNPLLADLLDTSDATCNPMGGLDVGPNFEVRETDQNPGRIYASGVIARGGYLAPVDSFWGFSCAALAICDDLARRGFCARLGLLRSISGWVKWLGGVTP